MDAVQIELPLSVRTASDQKREAIIQVTVQYSTVQIELPLSVRTASDQKREAIIQVTVQYSTVQYFTVQRLSYR